MKIPSEFIKKLDDFSFLLPLSAKFQIIGLGEATHGNKEFHLIRAEISKFLIERCGFSGVIMEFPYSKSDQVNQYILDGNGNLEEIMMDLGYWTCATEEIKQFIIWLRKFNLDNPKANVKLFGNDVDINDKIRFKAAKYRDRKMADLTIKIVGKSKYVLWAHNHHVSKFNGGDFTSMGYFLSKKVRYYNIATLFYEGSLTAMEYDSTKSQWGEVKQFKLSKAEPNSLEAKLVKIKHLDFFTNILELPIEISKQFNTVKARFLGAGFDPKEKASMFQQMNFSEMFNGFIFFRKVSPSVLVNDK